MKLSRLGEFGLIERVRRTTAQGRGVNLGIGDDAAWVQMRSGSCLLTADLLIEGVHFDLKWTSLYALGHKTLAVNMSDIAAMGGTPAYLLLSLGIPVTFESRSLCLSQPAWSAMRRILRSRVAAHKSGTTSM
jgi:thiamine-monophosphate kinase